jgi:hypothetical protein
MVRIEDLNRQHRIVEVAMNAAEIVTSALVAQPFEE